MCMYVLLLVFLLVLLLVELFPGSVHCTSSLALATFPPLVACQAV